MQFQTYSDISTQANKMTLITVYAGGNHVIYRCMPFFAAYKYYRLGPVNIKLVPASTLPVDPTGLSYTAGENTTVDPRDQLTPGVVRITNGEDFDALLPSSVADAKIQHEVYDAMMLDGRWFKWSLQSGLSKTAEPRYWMIGQVRQDYYPGATINIPETNDETAPFNLNNTSSISRYYKKYEGGTTLTQDTYEHHSSGRGLFQTGQHGTLGWLPTDASATLGFPNKPSSQGTKYGSWTHMVNAVPQVELFRIVMPPAYKTRYYYRMYITETVDFKEPVIQNPISYTTNGFTCRAPMDRFIRISGLVGLNPDTGLAPSTDSLPVPNDAANGTYNVQMNPQPPIDE